MIIYRLCASTFADSIDGSGAKLYGGRWNSIGLPMLYTTQHISLGLLEILVRIRMNELPIDHSLLKIDIPEKLHVIKVENDKLKKGWKTDIGYSRFIGDSFLRDGNAAAMQVPSAIIEDEYNYLLNPEHTDFKRIKISSMQTFEFDKRLFLKNE